MEKKQNNEKRYSFVKIYVYLWLYKKLSYNIGKLTLQN